MNDTGAILTLLFTVLLFIWLFKIKLPREFFTWPLGLIGHLFNALTSALAAILTSISDLFKNIRRR